MPDKIGEKIKVLRKHLNLTQTQLAGTEISKGMISQIENGLAKPSMKNLHYLAGILGRPVSYFVDNDYDENGNLNMEEINQILSGAVEAVRQLEYSTVINDLETLLKKYNFDLSSKIYADILSTLGEALVKAKRFDEGEDKLKISVDIYKSRNMYVDAAKSHMKLTARYFDKFEYEKCIEIINLAWDIYKSSYDGDSVFEIETLYQKAEILYGMGRIKEPLAILISSLEITKATRVFYKSDDIYKLMAIINMFQDKYVDFIHNINKARQFAEFTENNLSLASIEFAMSMYENTIFQPQKALYHIDNLQKYLGEKSRVYYLEKAKAFYLLEKYSEAKSEISLVNYPDTTLHKIDFLYMWSGKIYEGLIEYKLGNTQTALELILYGIQKIETLTPSKYHVFAYKSLSEVYSDLGDYENAFIALKKADLMQTELNQ